MTRLLGTSCVCQALTSTGVSSRHAACSRDVSLGPSGRATECGLDVGMPLPSVYLLGEWRRHFSAFLKGYELDNPGEMLAALVRCPHFFTSWLLPTGLIPLLKEPFLSLSPKKVPAPPGLQWLFHISFPCWTVSPRHLEILLNICWMNRWYISQRIPGSWSWKGASIFLKWCLFRFYNLEHSCIAKCWSCYKGWEGVLYVWMWDNHQDN